MKLNENVTMVKSNEKTKLTSVKILTNIYRNFKIMAFKQGITLQEVVNRSAWLYANDDDFRNKINEVSDLQISGSF